MARIKVWDPVVRLFHWSLVVGFTANALLIDDEAALHVQVGYAVAALVALRIVWGLIGTRHARFSDFPPSVSAGLEQAGEMLTGRRTPHRGHSPLGALMTFNLLASIGAIALTGYLMTTDAFWGTEWTEELHELAVTWTELSIVVHIAAVLFETRRTGVNLPRAMVTGYKDIPDPKKV